MHNLTVLLKEIKYILLVKFLIIRFSPIFEVRLGFAEYSFHDQGLKLLIMVCKTLCCSTNSLDNDQGIVEYLFYIVDTLAEVQKLKSVDEVDPANDLLFVEKHLHSKLN